MNVISSGNWVQVQKITPSDPKVFVFFGYAVSISGNHAIVGSYDDNTNALGEDPRSHAGSAYIYERDQSGKWNQIQKIVPKDRVAKDAFGISVNISGEVAMIGAFEALKKNQKQGKAYLFTRNESGTWDEYQRIIGPDGGLFGWKVSMDENQAVIGAPDVNNIGVAYVYEKDQGQFIQKAKLSTSDDSSFLNEFGFSVSISGNFILIGADLADKSGVAYVFEKVFGQWVFKQKLKAHDFSNSSLFGFSVGISKNRIVIGAPWDSKDEHGLDVSGMFRAGSAYFFEEPAEEKLKDANELCENLDVDYTIPNVITPNGDSFNDNFIIENLQEGTSLKIINRYGKSVFEEKKYLNDWNGEQLSAGTYFYVIRQESKNCFYEWRGWLSIIK